LTLFVIGGLFRTIVLPRIGITKHLGALLEYPPSFQPACPKVSHFELLKCGQIETTLPVPIARFTTFQQFREHLICLGCDHGDLPAVFSRIPMVYFERTVNGVLYDTVMKKRPDHEEVTPTEIQAACAKLQIEPIEFGFQFP
jgi:hypothetical protein